MDVYRVINEAKKSNLIDIEEMNKIYSLSNDAILMQIFAQEDLKDEKTDVGKLTELLLTNKYDYHLAKKNDELPSFNKELNSKIKKILSKDKEKVKRELFDKINEIAKNYQIDKVNHQTSPNTIVLRLFLNEWNTKYAFTWKSFKDLKKEYEKTHTLEGENLFVLKSLLEKDPNIVKATGIDTKKMDLAKGKIAKDVSGKITNSTVFSKPNNSLSKKTIEKIKEKIKEDEE